MCSSGQRLCSGSRRSPTSEGSSRGSQYALCALGMGLVALGVVMIVWTIVPSDAMQARNSTSTTLFPSNGKGDRTKTSSVAFVLVGAGIAMLLLAICLGVRNKKRMSRGENAGARSPDYVDRVPGDDEASNEEPAPSYDVPTYEEAVTGRYPVRQSNLRQSYQLPSYEDLISAVENEGQQPTEGNAQEAPRPQAAAPTSQPARSSSRASRILRPLRVRRIKSEKLHLRLNTRGPEQGGVVTIEPLTPPPQYEDKPPQLPTEPV